MTEKKYKAYFVGISEEQKKTFKDTRCALTVSVGQSYHENGKLNAEIKLIDRHFAYCNVLIGDTLQRHTLAIEQPDKTEAELYELAKKAGDEWIERNMQYISNFTIPYVISRWDEWLAKDKFSYYQKKVYELYYSSNTYKETADQIVHEFLSRRPESSINDQQLAFNLSLKYLLEESAVACLWFEAGYKFDVYPSGANLAMIIAQKQLVSEKLGFDSQSLRFRFKRPQASSVDTLKTAEYKDIATHYILNHAPGHIYWKDRNGVILGCNVENAKSFGFNTPDELIGKTNEDILDEMNAAYVSEIDNKVMSSGKEYIAEEASGGTQYFLSKKVPLRNNENQIIGLLGTSIDITEQKKLEFSLEKTVIELGKALESKEFFIKNMNHEIRIPMQLILNGSKLLKDNFYKFSDQEKLYFLDGMIKATNRLNDLVTNLLDMSKFKEGKFVLNLKIEDYSILFEEVIQEFSLMYNNKIEYITFLDNFKCIVCDKMRIQQVLRNLLMNSIKYGRNLTPISITLSNHEENGIKYFKCSIKDEGLGIPENERESVFESFVGSSLTKTVSGGIGLGLTISKEIIQSHNGRIWIDDLKINEIGTRISFMLPIESNI